MSSNTFQLCYREYQTFPNFKRGDSRPYFFDMFIHKILVYLDYFIHKTLIIDD
ncbi:hypothetical protein EVA_10383 [gut metagenome]|uniref:Uncharacterized protein n=1 Tax=gut metagenome TaxID=749906 RepID=J9GHX0_9ZZZZ